MFERLIDGPQGLLNVSETTAGENPPILFVHSDAGNLHHWDKIRLRLADRPTAAFDRRGHGRSAQPKSGSFAHADSAADIDAVADALGYDRFILVGHSGGALTSLAFASQEPERLLGLVLVDPPPDPAVLPPGTADGMLKALRGPGWRKAMEEHYRAIAGDDPAIIERLVRDGRGIAQTTIVGISEASIRFRPQDFTGYDGPALSIIQPQNDAKGAIHRIARMPHVAIEGAGHWIHLAAPERFLDALEEFIADIEQATPDAEGVTARAERRTGA